VHQASTTADRPAPAAPSWLGYDFACAVFVSAFLLFQVQPIISKYILPWYGGTPNVWTTCMLFFQVVLFGGYCYAHLTQRLFSPRTQATLHAVLLMAALALLPIEPAEKWKPLDHSDPIRGILGLLTVSVGLPYFILSSTGPLLQAWFSRAYQQRSPYRLYALSNIGSMLALLSYPFFFEWMWDLPSQAHLWSFGYCVFAILCGGVAFWTYRYNPGLPRKAAAAVQAAATTPDTDRPSWLQRLGWIGLPAVASLMLLATMNHIGADLPPIPFLYIVALAVYLLSFVISFDHDRWYKRGIFGIGTCIAVWTLTATLGLPHYFRSIDYLPVKWDLVLHFTMLFFVCMACHGEVARLRPNPRHLTEYFLLISLGGACGGLFVGLLAPNFFNRYWEWNIGLVAGYLVGVGVIWHHARHGLSDKPSRRLFFYGQFILAVVAFPVVFVWLAEPARKAPIWRARNFFGVVGVREHEKDNLELHHYSFRSGTIDHGKQFAKPEKRNTPVSYFAPHTGAGQTMLYFQKKYPDQPIRVGVIGMGVGILGAYARPVDPRQIHGEPIPAGEQPRPVGPADEFRFYEINPLVKQLAEERFFFLPDMAARKSHYEVVVHDGRFALERELAAGGGHKFQILYLDAFSGDAPPAHLLTKEAFAVYSQHLADDGVICVNAINSYINIIPVLEQAAKHFGWKMRRISTPKELAEKLYYRTDWVILSPHNDDLLAATVERLPDSDYLEDPLEVPLWTDKYYNLIQIFKRK